MAKLADNTVADGYLNVVKTGALEMWALSSSATDITTASAAKLASHVTASADYTIADAAGGGRKITTDSASGVTVANSGTYNHVALVTGVAGALLFLTSGTSQVLTAGNLVDFPAFTITVADPT